VNLSRVTWLVLGTTGVLVSAVLVAAVLFINGSSEPFPSGTGGGASGVAHIGSAGVGTAHQGRSAPGGRQVAAHPAVAGLAASLGPPGGGGPLGGPHKPGGPGPPGQQYGNSLEQLNAKLWGE
jgi:hypothetical protein